MLRRPAVSIFFVVLFLFVPIFNGYVFAKPTFDFLGFIKTLYDAYTKVKNFFEPDPDLAGLILQAKNEILEEINLVRAEEQIGNVNALIEEFTLYLNNPPSQQTLEAWIRDAINVSNQFEIIIRNKSPRIAYLSAKSYNLLIPLMAIMMQKQGIQIADIRPLFEDAIETNLYLLGDYIFQELPNIPLYIERYDPNDVNSSKAKLRVCYTMEVIDSLEYERTYSLVWTANEELRRQVIDHYENSWFYMRHVYSDPRHMPDYYAFAPSLAYRAFVPVWKSGTLGRRRDFLWKLDFVTPHRVRVLHLSGKYIEVALKSVSSWYDSVLAICAPASDDNSWRPYAYVFLVQGDPGIVSLRSNKYDANLNIPFLGYSKPMPKSYWTFEYAGLYEARVPHLGEPCPADYDGDTKADLAFKMNDGRWLIDYAANGFGSWDEIITDSLRFHRFAHPAPADYDGDGRADLAIKDDEDASWWIDYARNGFGNWDLSLPYGFSKTSPYVPVPSDYDGDGKADIAVYKLLGGWMIDFSKNGFQSLREWERYPLANYPRFPRRDIYALPGDLDGDGKADIVVKRDDGHILVDYSTNGLSKLNVWDEEFVIDMAAGAEVIPFIGNFDENPNDRELAFFRLQYGDWYFYQFVPGQAPSFYLAIYYAEAYDTSRMVYPFVADFNGDGNGDLSLVLDDGTWYIDYSKNVYLYGSHDWDWVSNMLPLTSVKGSVGGELVEPSDFSLRSYPNPFRKETQISFFLKTPGAVSVIVFDMLGREICTLLQERLPSGRHFVRWDGMDRRGRKALSGIYFCRIRTGDRVQVVKLILLK